MEKELKENPVIESLFKAGAHFGFSKSRRHPSTKPYIFGAKNKVEIIDLEKTVTLLDEAKKYVASLAAEGKQILFVGGKNEARTSVERGANEIGMPYVASRWIGGVLTNSGEIQKRVEKLVNLTSQKDKGELAKYTKKERLLIDRDIEKLNSHFAGLVPMKGKPGALFVIDSRHEHIAVDEANKEKVKIIALCGTDSDIKQVAYPIVANDSSIASINFFINEIVKAYKEGAKAAKPKVA